MQNDALLEELKNWPGHEIYVQKLGKLIENHYEMEKITFTPNKSAKNMMFKNMDADENQEVIMLDFQVCFYGTPAIDLIQAKYSLTNSDRKDELIESWGYWEYSNDQRVEGRIVYKSFLLSIFLVPFNFIDVASVNMEHLFGPDGDGDYIRRAFYKFRML